MNKKYRPSIVPMGLRYNHLYTYGKDIVLNNALFE